MQAHTAYRADPKSRYHDADFDDQVLASWAQLARVEGGEGGGAKAAGNVTGSVKAG